MTRRLERINSLIREEISELLRRDVKDPRLSSFLAITEVITSPDLRQAVVYVSYFGTSEEKHNTIDALTAASGFLHHELTKRLKMRHVPDLSFQWDDSIERGDRLLRLIDQVSAEKDDV
jgi:ribosome-binding factor A